MSRTDVYGAVPSLGEARAATRVSHHLAEGPVWDPIRRCLLWVDILDGAVYRGVLDGDEIGVQERIDFPDTAGAVAVSAGGELLVAGTRRLYARGADGHIRAGRELHPDDGRRFNDGKPDPSGHRFVVGTKSDRGEGELLLSIRSDGTVAVLDDDLTLANGLAWSADGRLLYTVDTLAGRIDVRSYDPETGRAGARELLLQIEHGYPDGMTIDADGHLWVAIWGGGCVLRISPDGRIVGRVDVDAPHTTCPVFAGPDLDALVITTATENLSSADLAAAPLSGRLFVVRTGFTGVAAPLWSGTVHGPAPSKGTS